MFPKSFNNHNIRLVLMSVRDSFRAEGYLSFRATNASFVLIRSPKQSSAYDKQSFIGDDLMYHIL